MLEKSHPSAFVGKWVPAENIVGNINIMLGSSKKRKLENNYKNKSGGELRAGEESESLASGLD